MGIKVRTKSGSDGAKSLVKKLTKIEKNTVKEIGKAIVKTSVLVESNIKRKVSEYKIVETGRELNSITHETEVVSATNFKGVIGTNLTNNGVSYPAVNELGNSTRAPRPAFRDGFNKSKRDIVKIIGKAQEKALKNGVK